MYEQLKKAVEAGTISRKTACRTAIKAGDKIAYLALFFNQSIEIINIMVDVDDTLIDRFDGTELTAVYC